MGHLKPDSEHRHGLHIDRHWPGLIISTWEVGKIAVLKRERGYSDKTNSVLTDEAWQFHIVWGNRRFGFRYESGPQL